VHCIFAINIRTENIAFAL